MTTRRMRFGIFLAPFHAAKENPDLAIERDFQLVEWLDELNYDEVWVGEHHSGGYEIIASPEIFVAAAAARTKRIRLGTGVSSVPYHSPLLLADRVMQLDHQTRGRFMFGMGPGALPSDAFMMGIDPIRQRDMLEEAVDVLVPLLSGETVTHKADWFELKDARLQLRPFTHPRVHMAVAFGHLSDRSPNRRQTRVGLTLLCCDQQSGFHVSAQKLGHCHSMRNRKW